MLDFSVREIINGYVVIYRDKDCIGVYWKEFFFKDKEELKNFIYGLIFKGENNESNDLRRE